MHVAEKILFLSFFQHIRCMTNVIKIQSIGEIKDTQSAEEWRKTRMTRNRFAHDYLDDWSKNSALISVACEATAEIYRILIGIENKLQTGYSGLVLGNSLPELVLSKTLKNG